MGFLIDTGIWIAVERGQLAVADVRAITKSAPVFISPVTIAELRLGLELMSDHNQRLKALAALRPAGQIGTRPRIPCSRPLARRLSPPAALQVFDAK